MRAINEKNRKSIVLKALVGKEIVDDWFSHGMSDLYARALRSHDAGR